MKVAITGGAGFLGTRLAEAILSAGRLNLDGAPPDEVTQLLLIDRVAPPDRLAADDRVVAVVGDLATQLAGDLLTDVDLVFHLAAAVSGEAERDLDFGLANNIDVSRLVFEACRHQAVPGVLVFASSVAVYGLQPDDASAVDIVDDALPTPLSSYGTQKLVCEQLLTDYTRRGLVRGRTVRLMTVTVRPGRSNAAASSFVSGIIREPLNHVTATCPVPPDTELAVSSPRRSIEGLLRAAAASRNEWGTIRPMNLPALTVTPRLMASALDRVAGWKASDLIEWKLDPVIAGVVMSWPARFRTDRAGALGLTPEPDFDTIVRSYLDEQKG